MMKSVVLLFVIIAGSALPAEAPQSVYTNLDEDTCRTLTEGEIEGRYETVGICEGVGDWTLYRRADDHGEWSAYSESSDIPVLEYGGYIGNFGSFHNVVEWRLDSSGKPFATIHRYYSMETDTSGEMTRTSVLIVTALNPGADPESCHVGYIRGSIPNANVLARDLADNTAREYDCVEAAEY